MSTKLRLSAIRNNLGLTLDEMAARLGISRSKYISIEKNPKKAEVGIIIEISIMSGIPLDMIDYGQKP
ncbi:MAG TPA: XRE family transcriptional regulator [Erysipelotrichaceae bacterium]|nr:XRE family transcriptional regulator [Erysipelotrichaceae bacterium]